MRKNIEFTTLIWLLEEEIHSRQHSTQHLLLLMRRFVLDALQSLQWGVYIETQMQHTPHTLFNLT